MRYLFLIVFVCCAVLQATSQTCPPNLDFENGDFSHWQCSAGSTDSVNDTNVIMLRDTKPIQGRHEIISAETNGTIPLDHYGKFPQLCPYVGKYSIKPGNTDVSAECCSVFG